MTQYTRTNFQGRGWVDGSEARRADGGRCCCCLGCRAFSVPSAEHMRYYSGLWSFASWFTVPPGKERHDITNECCYKGSAPLHAFAFRCVHSNNMRGGYLKVLGNPNGTCWGARAGYGSSQVDPIYACRRWLIRLKENRYS